MIPLRPLLKHKRKFQWKAEQQVAFNRIQNIIQESQLLSHPDTTKQFFIHTDSSDFSYGVILFQQDDLNPNKYLIIDIFSKYWNDSQCNLHITSKELLAVIYAINKWKVFFIHYKIYNFN
jgi:hypothetical protein